MGDQKNTTMQTKVLKINAKKVTRPYKSDRNQETSTWKVTRTQEKGPINATSPKQGE